MLSCAPDTLRLTPREEWLAEVVRLYIRSQDMEVEELESLLETALAGNRQDRLALRERLVRGAKE